MVCPLCYHLLNHRIKFNPNWCVSYSHAWGVQWKKKKGPAPWGPWEGSKGHISINYPHAFFKKRRGYCYRLHCPSVRPLCYLLLNHQTKFNQKCVSYSHEWGAQLQFFFASPLGALGRGQKVKYHLISVTKSISKIFIPNFVCVLTHERCVLIDERYKTNQTGFSFCRLGHALGVGLGVLRGPNQILSCCLSVYAISS